MSKRWILCLLMIAGLVVMACSRETTERPDAVNPDTGTLAGARGTPPSFYTYASNHDPNSTAFSDLELLDPVTGAGTIITPLNTSLYDERGLACPLGLAFDLDGTMYTIVNWLLGPEPLAMLAREDMRTGEVTWIGDYKHLNFSSPVFDRCGNLYAMGFNIGPNGQADPWFIGDTYLYRFDKYTGDAWRVGDTGIDAVMDMAFDSHGNLYASTMNKLFLIDPETAASTFVTDITGVPANACGIPLEVMSIAFDAGDVLYATAIEGFAYECYETNPVMTIDVGTGAAHVIGWTGQWYNHGGDIMPTKVRVCHRTGGGRYVPLVIDLNGLADHRSHGDIVPGVDGAGCNCPDLPIVGEQ